MNSRFWILIGVAIALAVLVGIFVIANVANNFETGGTGGGFTGNTCSTKCIGFREYRCEDQVEVGKCFGTWGCGDGVGGHPCQNQTPVSQGYPANVVDIAQNCGATPYNNTGIESSLQSGVWMLRFDRHPIHKPLGR